jgi:DNA-binding transcriptional MerR regulator
MTTLSGSSLFDVDIAKKYFSTREVAKSIGVHRMTIHEWCVKFGIHAKRNRRGHRMLSVEDFGKLRVIARCRYWGMTHNEIAYEVMLNGWPDPERVIGMLEFRNQIKKQAA